MNETKHRLIRLPEVMRLTACSRSTIYARLKKSSPYYDPSFPRPVPLSNSIRGAVAWLEAEVLAWIETRRKLTEASSAA